MQYANQSEDAAVHVQHRQGVGLQGDFLLQGSKVVVLKCRLRVLGYAGHQSDGKPVPPGASQQCPPAEQRIGHGCCLKVLSDDSSD